jgi:Polyketide cyclase / dehydrase and lipid transport
MGNLAAGNLAAGKEMSAMASYEATVPSAWTADETFSYLAVFSNAAQWDPGVLTGRPLDAGPARVGSRYRLVVPFLGLRLPLVYQVSELSAADRVVTLVARNGLLCARDRIAVSDQPAGQVLVSYRADVSLRGPLRILEPMLRKGFRAVGDRAAAGLSAALSAARPATKPAARPARDQVTS